MENTYCVYIHTNKINNKKYVGLTKRNPEKRWLNGKGYKNSVCFKHAIEKYGWENFKHDVVSSNMTADEASALETELIKKFNTTNIDYGYNLDSGGSFTTHSEITKEKIRSKITGLKRSQETIEKIRKASTGNKNCLGRKQTEESKQKNREAHMNKTHILSEESKERIALGHKDRKEIICIELNKIFPSIGLAAKYVNGSQGTISSVLCGTRKTAYGYHWVYNNNVKV